MTKKETQRRDSGVILATTYCTVDMIIFTLILSRSAKPNVAKKKCVQPTTGFPNPSSCFLALWPMGLDWVSLPASDWCTKNNTPEREGGLKRESSKITTVFGQKTTTQNVILRKKLKVIKCFFSSNSKCVKSAFQGGFLFGLAVSFSPSLFEVTGGGGGGEGSRLLSSWFPNSPRFPESKSTHNFSYPSVWGIILQSWHIMYATGGEGETVLTFPRFQKIKSAIR